MSEIKPANKKELPALVYSKISIKSFPTNSNAF